MKIFQTITAAAIHDFQGCTGDLGVAYAIFFFDGEMKVGYSKHPSGRFYQYGNNTDLCEGIVLVSDPSDVAIVFEANLISALRPVCRNRKNPKCEWFRYDHSIMGAVVNHFNQNCCKNTLPRIHFEALMSDFCAPKNVKWTIDQTAPLAYHRPLAKKLRESIQ